MKILSDLRAVTRITQLGGIMPIFYGNDLENFRIGVGGRLYGQAVALVLVVATVFIGEDVLFSAQEYKIMRHLQGDTEDINRTIETLFCIWSYTSVVLAFVLNSAKHYRTLRDVAKLDEYLQLHGFQENYSCRFLSFGLSIISASVVIVAYYYVHYRSDINGARECILLSIYALQMFYSCMFAIYLRCILKCLTQRIAFLNQRLDNFTRQEKLVYDKEDWRELSNLIETFCKFRYVTENLNSVTGVALLFYFGFAFYTVTNQSYLAFSTLTTPMQLRSEYDTMGLSLAWVLAETATMAVICSSFDCLSSEANETSQILARVYGKSKEFQNIIDKFLTKSIKQEVQFTAYGFFAIDNSTLFKIFSAVTTYLVILIQFKQLEDSKLDDQTGTQAN
ncbi:gustatory receptor 68a [Drosophila busckii]|uniref:gustatory receptor 68a n=1 Tax=Drosophila busckii TaxID=30019 RepID=UPI00083F2D4C|nr:gustatory receptor 68a [Drosophila busckii]